MEDFDVVASNTFGPNEPSFYSGKTAHTNAIDYLLAQRHVHQGMRPAWTCTRLGACLQLVTAARPIDRFQVMAGFPYCTVEYEREQFDTWDKDALAASVVKGQGKVQFLQRLEQLVTSTREEWHSAEEAANKDTMYDLLARDLRTAAADFKKGK